MTVRRWQWAVVGLLAGAGMVAFLVRRQAAVPRPPAAEPLFSASSDSAAASGGPTALRFEDGTRASGIDFRHLPTRSAERWLPETMGSGVVLADFNRDGAPDVVLINSGRLPLGERPADARNRLYLNDGQGRFRDATEAWSLPSPGYGMGGTAGDFDNDGWPDLYLTTYGGEDRLLRNTGSGFEDVTRAARLTSDGAWSTSAGFLDLDNDGDLDLYLVRYVRYTLADALRCYHNKVHVYCTPLLYDAVADRLFRNNGNGTFTDISRQEKLAAQAGKGLALVIGDVDGDGDQDLYIANDTSRNNLWINDGRGHLEDHGLASGTALSEAGAEEAGMGADLADVDGNGRADLVCTNFQGESTSLYSQEDSLRFREISDAIGIGETARARLSFGTAFLDADDDGDLDLVVANGHIEDNVATYSHSVTFEQQNTLYENRGSGRFRDVSDGAGPALQDRQVSRGLAVGDLDGDGDLDFIVANNGGTAQVATNTTTGRGHWVGLWLEGRKANRSAFGAKVDAKAGALHVQRELNPTNSYLSHGDDRLHLGLGAAAQVDTLVIHWPGGERQQIVGLATDRYYHVLEGRAPRPFEPGQGTIAP